MNTPTTTTQTITVRTVKKAYRLYDKPVHRLWDALLPATMQRGREFWAVKGVSFSASAGQTVGIIGSNGSGKSTLLQMLAGTLQISSGSIEVSGRVVALLELGAGFNPELTGRENCRLCAAIHGVAASELDAVCQQIHAFADIGDFIEQPVKNYSSGMFVRLAFAVIAHVKADVMIVDEALSVGDAYFAQKCARFFAEFKRVGTIVLVSHDLATVKQLCDHVIWLEKGEVLAEGDPKTVVDAYLKSLYAKDQAVDTVTMVAPPHPEQPPNPQDQRLSQAIPVGVWNQLKALRFDPSDSFGAGKASIAQAYFRRRNQPERLDAFHGGEWVRLVIEAIAVERVESPILGFFVRNRSGVNLFGDNSFLSAAGQNHIAGPGQTIRAEFEFVMPSLPKGEYAVCVAIATGSNEQHEQQHWVNDAIMINSLANDVHADVMGIPMLSINVEVRAA